MTNSDFSDLVSWTPEAQDLLKRIPFFVRSQARQRIEALARRAGTEVITSEFVEQVRTEIGQ
jgi:hypothetical protein